MIRRPVGWFLIVFFCSGLMVPASSQASTLNRYVKRYRQIPVSNEQKLKIHRYRHLIDYFSSFAFFKPNHTVNGDFIRALMLAESNGDPGAVSGKGARGLCQIMYTTGKQAAKELVQKNINFRYVSKRRLLNLKPDDLHTPAINILLTCYLISKYNYTFQGKLDLVVAAWNAGENSIVGNRPPRYRETLDLIGKVNGYFIHFVKYGGRN